MNIHSILFIYLSSQRRRNLKFRKYLKKNIETLVVSNLLITMLMFVCITILDMEFSMLFITLYFILSVVVGGLCLLTILFDYDDNRL